MSQDKIELTLEARTVEGKAVKQLRRDGIVPAVVHDHGKPSLLVQGENNLLLKVYRQAGKHHPIQLTAGNKHYTAMIKDIEFEPRKQGLTHIIFNAVSANEKVTTEVPVRARYDEGNEASPAERAGLMVLPHLTSVTVEAVSSKLPDAVEYDGEKLTAVGDHVTVADLIVPSGVTVVTDAEEVVAAVNDPAAIAEANDAAGGDAEPGDEQAVETDVTPDSAEEPAQADEIRPGGKREFEDKSQGHNPEKK